MTERVAVLGGGVAGLTAAHELSRRGFDVTVYEAGERVGGKARSVPVPGTGDPPLPGEHGFRFFPGFYRHVIDTMERIPDGDGRTVADHLVPTERTLVARIHGDHRRADVGTPDTLGEWFSRIRPAGGEVPPREAAFYTERMLELLTSCERRRRKELDEVTWWDFLEADRMSDGYRAQLVEPTQALVAIQPRRASARTVGRVYAQLLVGQLDPRVETERILDGPTSEVWLQPWREHVESLGADVVTGARVTDLELSGHRIAGATVDHGGDRERVTADRYVLAVPVEVAVDLLTEDLRRAAPSLAGIRHLETAWMNGIQFYLREDVPVVAGHQLFVDSPWALTAISQAQFWNCDLRERGDGEVEGVLSVIVSDWNEPGRVYGKPAKECTPGEIREEVWTQLCAHLNREGRERLHEDLVVDWFLDPELRQTDDGVENDAPLLVNTVGALKHRPPADPEVPNLYIAGDYARTNTDLASMEAADEAGRRAANAVLDDAGSTAQRCRVWELSEPSIFEPLKAQDRVRYRLGLPHPGRARTQVRGALRDLLA
ncbi:phytoene dehydrogenase [Halobacteriales archaeon QS_1_68_20]|nr:MAG: phytoene dehydrogenase [Halobacteriales archaeon QS_1_68_20]